MFLRSGVCTPHKTQKNIKSAKQNICSEIGASSNGASGSGGRNEDDNDDSPSVKNRENEKQTMVH